MTTYQTETYEWTEVAEVMRIDRPLNAYFERRVVRDFANTYEYRLRAYLVSKKAPDVIECSYPSDWWEAFKDRWFPSWAKKRWPVRMTRRSWDVVAMFPESNISRTLGQRYLVIDSYQNGKLFV